MDAICVPILVGVAFAWVCTKIVNIFTSIFPAKEEQPMQTLPLQPPQYSSTSLQPFRTPRVPDHQQQRDISSEIDRLTAEIEREIEEEKRRLQRDNPKVVARRPSYRIGEEPPVYKVPPPTYAQPLGPGPEAYKIMEDGEWKTVRRGTVEYNELWSQLPGAKVRRR